MPLSSAPRVTADRTAALSREKRELLEMRLRGKSPTAHVDQIQRRPAGVAPLSFGQQRIWFQSQISGNASLFNIPLLAEIEGGLDVTALERAMGDIIARHEVLRSGFLSTDNGPELFFVEADHFSIARVDWRNLDEAAQQERLRAEAEREAATPFDLARPPLLRATLLTFGAERAALLLTIHHIVWDGWSSGLLIEELSAAYAARRRGEPPPAAPLAVQYTDFAHWHRRLMASATGAAQLRYWIERLTGAPEVIDLPTDRARPAQQAHRGARHGWMLSQRVSNDIEQLARSQNATLFVVVLSAFVALLHRYSGQGDLVVGTTIAYRARPELEKVIGFFTNALALRASVDRSMRFDALIDQLRRVSADAQAHQDTPFEALVERLVAKRGLSHNPLFQVAFVHHNIGARRLDLPGLSINVQEIDTHGATFDLVLHLFNEPAGLRLEFEYDADLFESPTIASMAQRFTSLIESAVVDPAASIGALRLVDEDEEQQLRALSSGVALAPGEARLLHDCLAGAAPDAIAVESVGASMRYEDLEQRSDAIARALQARGVRPETPVGVLVEQGVDFVAAIFGVLKAGGAFVPLDVSLPAARLGYILCDAQVKVVVTTDALVARCVSFGVAHLSLEACAQDRAQGAVLPAIDPENLAYIIYTSGSTGRAKGVMVTHANAVASLRARAQYYEARVDSFLLLSSLSFDSALAGLFWTLMQGGRLCMPTEESRRDPGELSALMTRWRISHLLALPSLYEALLRVISDEAAAALTCGVVAGEVCTRDVVAVHMERAPHAALFNEYGPTECAIWSTAHRVGRDDGVFAPVPIGAPIAGAHAYVLDRDAALQPLRVPGQLCIAGGGVSRGYVGRAGLTADKFRPDPFGQGARLYCTGDRATLAPGGDITFLGRVDDQIKIRGYRVDPREVEAALLEHALVAEAVVVASAAGHTSARLYAFVVLRERSADATAIERHARETLPDYMTPHAIHVIGDLPRLPNGKIDRASLLSGLSERTAGAAPRGAPQNAIELILSDIWRDVIEGEEIGREDNFFDLGGNSLAAVQVMARVQQTFGAEIPITSLFETNTLAEFGEAVTQYVGEEAIAAKLTALLGALDASQPDGAPMMREGAAHD